MTPSVKILAATDLSAPARHAVERAFRIAQRAGGDLHIVHALQLSALDAIRELFGAELSRVKEALEASAHEQVAQLVGDPAHRGGVAARARVVSGTPSSVIADEADALDAKLVVLGARGESFLRHTLLGSTATRLVRKSLHRPVLVVKQVPRADYRTALIAVDFSPASSLAIRTARQLAPDAILVLLHAYELPYEGKLAFAGVAEQVVQQYIRATRDRRRTQLDELAADTGLVPESYVARIAHGNPFQHIIAAAQEYDWDLIVVGKHGARIEDLLLGSVTTHVLNESQGDVLVVSDRGSGSAERD